MLARSLANSIGGKGPVDVVVAWVDGRDRKHRAKRRRYLADPGGDTKPERMAVKAQRFSDNDEIRYCLRSIHNYAPWVRTIWLVTDDQVPASIARRRAERYNIRIVDHREIFRGYEQLLPTFNSLAIETMLWRIEGLADRFLYFNDDMMLVGPVKPADFFCDRAPRSPVAQVEPGTDGIAQKLSAFPGGLLLDRQPRRPRNAAEAAYGRHD